jgi:transposase
MLINRIINKQSEEGRMLKMDQYAHIRTAHRVYGKKIREIARETGHSKNTVKKALRREYCGYSKRQCQPYPVLGPYREMIDDWLQRDKDQPKKQRHTAHRIYTRLVEEHGFCGSEPTVRRYVREAKARFGLTGQTAFIPLEPEIGREAEVDWGNASAVIHGVQRGIKYFCMRSKYSSKHFVRCYPCEQQQAFFDAHLHAFEFFGGIFGVLIYDNLTSAVRKVLRGRHREEQAAFQKFRSYHNFEARFCNPGQGHEKGGVEGLVGYVRRNYLVPVPHADDFPELNQHLLEQCLRYGEHRVGGGEQSVNDLFCQERAYLLPLPQPPFTNIQTLRVKVNKYATALVHRNHYSVPTQYVGFTLEALVSTETVQFCYQHKEVASHARVYGNNKWQLNPLHYLTLLQQRPRAFDSARPLKQWRKTWPACLEALLRRLCDTQGQNKGIKDFITVLLLYQDYPADDIEAAVELALETHISSSEGVKHLLRYSQPEAGVEPLSQWSSFPPPDVSVYTQLQTDPEAGIAVPAIPGADSETEMGGPPHAPGGDAR